MPQFVVQARMQLLSMGAIAPLNPLGSTHGAPVQFFLNIEHSWADWMTHFLFFVGLKAWNSYPTLKCLMEMAMTKLVPFHSFISIVVIFFVTNLHCCSLFTFYVGLLHKYDIIICLTSCRFYVLKLNPRHYFFNVSVISSSLLRPWHRMRRWPTILEIANDRSLENLLSTFHKNIWSPLLPPHQRW